MGFFQRTKDILESHLNKALDNMEDPNAMLDLSYEKMLSGLQEVKAHLADVVTEEKRLENQLNQVKKDMDTAEEDAKAALKMNREDLAQKALEKKHAMTAQLQTLQQSFDSIHQQAEHLKETQQKYQDRIANFKTQKEVTKATFQAAQAEVKVNESMAGVGKTMGNVGAIMDRANDKVEKMTAHAQALESLAQEGLLTDPLDHRDNTQKELDAVRTQSAVEDDLARLKKEMSEN